MQVMMQDERSRMQMQDEGEDAVAGCRMLKRMAGACCRWRMEIEDAGAG